MLFYVINSMYKKIFLLCAIFFMTFANVEANEQEAEAVRLLNEVRAEHGLKSVAWDENSKLQAAARVRAQEITENFSHTRPNGSSCFSVLKEFRIKYWSTAENIAMGTYLDAEGATELWINSPGHFQNMVNGDLKEVGLACYQVGDEIYWVQLFIG